MATVYKDYFQIDEDYFPCVNESAINAGLKWDGFFPHTTFIDLLRNTERILSRQEKRSIWISGAYGTGKSYAAFALSKLLIAPSEEVEAYFNKFDALSSHKTDLMQRLITAKEKGRILTCYRYASSSISSSNDLIIIMQEQIAKAVKEANLEHTGTNTLKQGILNWLDDERHRQLLAGYIENEYKDLFGGWNLDDIIDRLKKADSATEYVSKISQMANEIGIHALKLDMDGFISYIKEIITNNNLNALFFVMDEFSEFFQNNRFRLGEFQKLVELCGEVPFYLVVVAHQIDSYFHEKDTELKKLRDRFISCNISMPDNIAFDLMRDALKIKDEALQDWENKLDDLQDFTRKSRKAVSECTNIEDNVLKGVLPLHPMSALLLKHISSAFESNQRSMFDFIKNDGDYKAFQWFIDNHGPLDGVNALLTVDMLWDFFYESGKENLELSIRNILDTHKKAESRGLVSEEYQVLKTILIMQAVSTHLNDAIPLFIANEQNLYLCFEGTDYEHKAPAIAEKLVRDEVIYKKTLGNNKFCYASMVMAGDAAELDKRKKEVIERLRTSELCIDEFTRAFSLTPQLKLRYNLSFADYSDIAPKTNKLVNEENSDAFHAIVGIAKNDNEALLLRKLMQEKIKNDIPEVKNIIYIDTTPTPFGQDSIEQYAEYMANSEMQRGKDNHSADDMLRKGKKVAGDWGNRIHNGQIIIYSKGNPEGDRYENWSNVTKALPTLVEQKYPYVFEYSAGLTEVTLQSGSKQQWVEAGITEKSGGQTASAEKLVNKARSEDKYWVTDPHSPLGIIKNALDERINDELATNSKISVVEVLSFLCKEYGFIPSNLYSFLTGFLLKEYANEAYRLSDEAVNEKMSAEKMKQVVDEAYKQFYVPNSRYRDKYIRIMSHEEQLFCSLMSDVFDIPENQCGSVEDAIKRVRIKEKSSGLPAWVLTEKAAGIEADFVSDYIKLLNPEQGHNISVISGNIGKLVESDESLAQKLKQLMTDISRRDSMKSYLSIFAGGKLLSLAKEIGAEERVIDDIQKRFGDDTAGLWLWNKKTGEEQIHKVIDEYEFIKKSNELLLKRNSSVANTLASWEESLKFVKISHELAHELPDYAPFTNILFTVAKGAGRDSIKEFIDVLTTHNLSVLDLIKNNRTVLAKSCAFELQGLSEQEINEIYKHIPNGSYLLGKQEYLQKIQHIVDEYKSNLEKLKLRNLWNDKTATASPYEWSRKYKTPLLACVPIDKWNDYKRAFGAINRTNPEDSEVSFALEYLLANPIWDIIANGEIIDKAFTKTILGSYKAVLTDLDEVRDYLSRKTVIEPYDWSGQTEIVNLVKGLAQSKYTKEPFDRVMRRIDSMKDDKLRDYLVRLVKENMNVGIEILEDGEEG